MFLYGLFNDFWYKAMHQHASFCRPAPGGGVCALVKHITKSTHIHNLAIGTRWVLRGGLGCTITLQLQSFCLISTFTIDNTNEIKSLTKMQSTQLHVFFAAKMQLIKQTDESEYSSSYI